MPLGLYFAHAGRRLITKAFAVAALVVLALAFVRTGIAWRIPRSGRGRHLHRVPLLGDCAFAGGCRRPRWWRSVLVVTASEQYWRQMGTILSDADYNHTEESGRLQIWKRGRRIHAAVTGVRCRRRQLPNCRGHALAVCQSASSSAAASDGTRPTTAYIQIGAELGFPGLLLFLAALASGFTALVGPQRSAGGEGGLPDRTSALRQALVSSLIGFVVGAFFLSLAYHEIAIHADGSRRRAQKSGGPANATQVEVHVMLSATCARVARLGAHAYLAGLRMCGVPARRRCRQEGGLDSLLSQRRRARRRARWRSRTSHAEGALHETAAMACGPLRNSAAS